MKVKTETLSGAALNWAVAICDKKNSPVVRPHQNAPGATIYLNEGFRQNGICFNPSDRWGQGMPILDKSRISLQAKHAGWWTACIFDLNDESTFMCVGDTMLATGLRCYVLSTIGDTVDLPEQLAAALHMGVSHAA
jgi:hypothetical protein